MKLAELKSAGGIVSDELVKKNVKWTRKVDDVEETLDFDVYIKRSRYGTLEKINQADGEKSRIPELISQSVFLGDDGKEVMSYQDAYDLQPSLAAAFIVAIHEVNGTSGKPKN